MSSTNGTNGNLPAKRAPNEIDRNVDRVRRQIDTLQGELTKALRGTIDPQWFARVAVTLYRTGGKGRNRLALCTPESFVASLFEGAQFGLNPAPQMGEFWIVPRWDGKAQELRATFQIGVQGWITLARRAGTQTVRSRRVFRGDEFDIIYGTQEQIIHRPSRTADRRDDNLTDVYAVAEIRGRDGSVSTQFEWMSRQDIEISADRTLNKDGKRSDAWIEHFASMAQVRVVGRLAKWLPRDERLALALARDGMRADGIEPEPMMKVEKPVGTVVPMARPSLGEAVARDEETPDRGEDEASPTDWMPDYDDVPPIEDEPPHVDG